MLKKFWEDCKYIAKVASQDFQLVVAIKITLIPFLVAVTSYAAGYWHILAIPKWAWIPITVFTIVVYLLFILARQMRIFEKPKVDVFCEIEIKSAHELDSERKAGVSPYNLSLLIKNSSFRRIDGVKVKLHLMWVNGRIWKHLDVLLPILNHENANEISINPMDDEKAKLGKYWWQDGTSHYKIFDIEYTDFPEVNFLVQISSQSFPAITKWMALEVPPGGGFSFKEVKEE